MTIGVPEYVRMCEREPAETQVWEPECMSLRARGPEHEYVCFNITALECVEISAANVSIYLQIFEIAKQIIRNFNSKWKLILVRYVEIFYFIFM